MLRTTQAEVTGGASAPVDRSGILEAGDGLMVIHGSHHPRSLAQRCGTSRSPLVESPAGSGENTLVTARARWWPEYADGADSHSARVVDLRLADNRAIATSRASLSAMVNSPGLRPRRRRPPHPTDAGWESLFRKPTMLSRAPPSRRRIADGSRRITRRRPPRQSREPAPPDP